MRRSALWPHALFAAAYGCTIATSSASRDDIGGEQYRALENAALPTPEASLAERSTHVVKTTFLIVMENRNWSEIKGNPAAPYINTVLLPMGAHAENYLPRGIHPSEPNYIWLEAGDDLGISNDAPPVYNNRTTRAHLTRYLDAANVSWRSYQEGIAPDLCPFAAEGLYDPKHNPMMYFDDVIPECASHVRPFEELARDLSTGAAASYNFITPNLCDDMHNALGCATGDQIRNGDLWLAAQLPTILASDAYKAGGAIFITWDEGGGAETPIGMIVLSPFAKKGYAGNVEYSHGSTLRTMQRIFAVPPYLRDAADREDLGDLFVSFP